MISLFPLKVAASNSKEIDIQQFSLLWNPVIKSNFCFWMLPPNRNIYNQVLTSFISKSLPSSPKLFGIKFIRLTIVFSLYNTQGTSKIYQNCCVIIIFSNNGRNNCSEHLMNCRFQLYNFPAEFNIIIREFSNW